MSLLKKLGFSLIAMVIAFAGCGEMDANEFEAGTPGEAAGVILDQLGDQYGYLQYTSDLTKQDTTKLATDPTRYIGPVANYMFLVGAFLQGLAPNPGNQTYSYTLNWEGGNYLTPNGIKKVWMSSAINGLVANATLDTDTDNDGDVDSSDNGLLWTKSPAAVNLTLSWAPATAPLTGFNVTCAANAGTAVYVGLRYANLDNYITSGVLKVTVIKYNYVFNVSATGAKNPISTDAIFLVTGDLKEVQGVGRISFVNFAIKKTYNFVTKAETVAQLTSAEMTAIGLGGQPNYVYFNIPSTTAFIQAAAAEADPSIIGTFCVTNAAYEGSTDVVFQ